METSKKLAVYFFFSSFFFLLFTINQTMSASVYPNQTMSESVYIKTFCYDDTSPNSTRNTTYNTNLNTLLSVLSDQSSINNYYNLTTGLGSDTVHGMFFCTGDIDRTRCNNCVKTATFEIFKNCTNHRKGIIYYSACMVRYSDKYFLSYLETKPPSFWRSYDKIPKEFGKFKERLSNKMEGFIVRSSQLSSNLIPYYVNDTTRFDNLYDLKSVLQCTPDLDRGNCTKCLKKAFQEVKDCCSGRRWALLSNPKCSLYFSTILSSPNGCGSFSIKGNNKILGVMVLAVATSVFAFMGFL